MLAESSRLAEAAAQTALRLPMDSDSFSHARDAVPWAKRRCR